MEKVIFNGEHLFVGNLGHFFAVLAAAGSLLAAIFYQRHHKTGEDQFRKFARWSFYASSAAVIGVVICLFYIINRHYYEYQYAWSHSSNDLPLHYMISCFWEGQEGSYLLWMFWQCVIGLALILTAGRWESPVLLVIALVQFAIGTMLLGVDVAGLKIGSSPFELLREAQPQALDIPMLKMAGKANYLNFYKDGNGLNPLLQNYWMVIHPPTLFFGFASAIVPFAFAIAGMMTGRLREWIRPAVPWTLISVMVLGTGIIMGGFWAYESLSFGGYWNWDPVENASLMPWLLLVATAHILLINRATGKHVVLSIFLACISFLLVLYATFLTRSGILGDASVHSFTGEGTMGQLMLFMFGFTGMTFALGIEEGIIRKLYIYATIFIVLFNIVALKYNFYGSWLAMGNTLFFLVSVWLFIRGLQKRVAAPAVEDKLFSRELWMFTGSLFVVLSLFQVFVQTSNPVWNHLFGLKLANIGPDHYNKWQLWLAMPIALLMAAGQFFRYRDSDRQTVLRNLAVSFTISSVVTIALMPVFGVFQIHYLLFLFLSLFVVVGNIYFLIQTRKNGWSFSGGSIAHAGFGLMLAGILVSSAGKNIISYNNGHRLFSETDESGKPDPNAIAFNRDFILLEKDKPVKMGDYLVYYRGWKMEHPNKHFQVEYHRYSPGKSEPVEKFFLEPNAQNNPKMGLVANPDTRHYISRDVFTHINLESGMAQQEDFSNQQTDTVRIGQVFLTGDHVKKLTLDSVRSEVAEGDSLMRVRGHFTIEAIDGKYAATSYWYYKDGMTGSQADTVNEAGVLVGMRQILAESGGQNARFIIETATRKPQRDWIVMKAIVFPWINLLWSGTIIMIIGFLVAIIRRTREYRSKPV